MVAGRQPTDPGCDAQQPVEHHRMFIMRIAALHDRSSRMAWSLLARPFLFRRVRRLRQEGERLVGLRGVFAVIFGLLALLMICAEHQTHPRLKMNDKENGDG